MTLSQVNALAQVLSLAGGFILFIILIMVVWFMVENFGDVFVPKKNADYFFRATLMLTALLVSIVCVSSIYTYAYLLNVTENFIEVADELFNVLKNMFPF